MEVQVRVRGRVVQPVSLTRRTGCSSMVGLLFELGPCSIADDGYNTTYNPYGWNSEANMIFLDQPVNVGWSYTDDNSTVKSSPAASEDVYAFMQIFLKNFEQYANAQFHIAGESYGGTYVPHFASYIHQKNKQVAGSVISSDLLEINLASVLLGNGLTNPYVQFGSVPIYACEGPYAILHSATECKALQKKAQVCQTIMQLCYDTKDLLLCTTAWKYCTYNMWEPVFSKYRSSHFLRMSNEFVSGQRTEEESI